MGAGLPDGVPEAAREAHEPDLDRDVDAVFLDASVDTGVVMMDAEADLGDAEPGPGPARPGAVASERIAVSPGAVVA